MKLDENLKAAIVRLPAKEKDKLLLRLVAKDAKLIRRLEFELLENGETRDIRAAALKQDITDDLRKVAKDYLTPGYLLMFLRHWNARIAEHVHATQDKLNEVALPLFMLAEAFRLYRPMLDAASPYKSDTFAPYVVKRTRMALSKAPKLHEDYFIEFRKDATELLEHIWSFAPTAAFAKHEGLPAGWDF